ncbi:uncharacterized protein LOC144577090 [Callithrix jacchus]
MTCRLSPAPPRCPPLPLSPKGGWERGQSRQEGRSPSRSTAAHKALHLLLAFQAPPWASLFRGSLMPPSVAGGTVRFPLASLSPPSGLSLLLPAPRLTALRELSPGSGGARAPHEPGPLRPRGADNGPFYKAQLRPAVPPPHSEHTPRPRGGGVRSRPAPSPGGGRAQPQPRSYLPGVAGAAGSERTARPGPSPAPRRVSALARRWLPGCPADPSLGLPVGLDKGHFLGGAESVPSMPRFVVPGDFLPLRRRAPWSHWHPAWGG